MSLKLKINLFSVVAIFLLSTMIIGSNLLVSNLLEERYSSSVYDRDQVVWLQVADNFTHKMSEAVREISRDRDLLKGLKNGDDASVDEAFAYKYNRMFAEGVLTHALILDNNHKIISANPDGFVFSELEMIRSVAESKEAQQGFIKNNDGKTYLAYAFPIFYRGSKTVGTGVYMKDLKDLSDMSKKYLTADIFVVDPDDYNISYATTDIGWDKGAVIPVAGESHLDRLKLGEAIYEITATPIQSYNKQPVATLLSQKDLTESITKEDNFRKTSYMVTALIIISFAVAFFLFLSFLFRPLVKFEKDLVALSQGNLDITIDTSRTDEIGSIAKAMQVFRDNIVQKTHIEREQKEKEQKERTIQAQKEREELAAEFDKRTSSAIRSLADSSKKMKDAASYMDSVSQKSISTSSKVLDTASNAEMNVNSVASATQELFASSHEISQQINFVVDITNKATSEARKTGETVQNLKEMALSIGEVVNAISDISEQTNLLALNATIEAARAGEAGKGFAVVADEVKVLANETSKKTEEINHRITMIQEAVDRSVTDVENIIEAVHKIDQVATSVGSAVEEQNAATGEIGRNATEASDSTKDVRSSVEDMKNAACETGKSSQSVLHEAEDLAVLSKGLQTALSSFLKELHGERDDHV